MYQVIHELSLYLRGWVGYFGIQEFKYLFRDLDAWIRSRLRSMQLKKWKKPRKFQQIMIKAGFDPKEAYRVWIKNEPMAIGDEKTGAVCNEPEMVQEARISVSA